MAKADDQKKEIEKAHTDRPVSPTDDPTDHSVPASAIAAQTDPQGKGGATVSAKSIDAVNAADEAKRDAERLDEDKSVFGKARRAGIFFVRNHNTGEDYVGISPQNDPEASDADKRRSAVFPLDTVSPRTGMIVKPKDGDAFTVGDGFGPDKTPADWAAVVKPDGSPLFG